MPDLRERPLSVAILALGGQGGGVLTKWLVDIAERNGYLAQSTYVAGVAQRTGATVYCVEVFPAARAAELGKKPVFTPYPVPGDVDVVVAGEMAETGRAIQKGFVTPNITTLIASSHRVYSVVEKSALGDGIVDQGPVRELAAKAAKKFVCFDMQAAAENCDSVVSAVLLGAIAGTGALPFGRDTFEATIRAVGRAVDSNLLGFAAGYEQASRGESMAAVDGTAMMPPATPEGANGHALQARIAAQFPPVVGNVALHGALRALDYQDSAYAGSYLDRLASVLALDKDNGGDSQRYALTAEVARQLALQMCYEDTLRVADLKTRAERMDRVRDQIGAEAAQPADVIEYFHPRYEEMCDTLPAALGARLHASTRMRRLMSPLFASGRNLATTKITGFTLLYALARIQRWRRGTYRFRVQEQLIDDWLRRIAGALSESYDYALAVAECIEIVKGYGDTYERGLSRYRATVAAASGSSERNGAALVRGLQSAALADEKGRLFAEKIAELETAA